MLRLGAAYLSPTVFLRRQFSATRQGCIRPLPLRGTLIHYLSQNYTSKKKFIPAPKPLYNVPQWPHFYELPLGNPSQGPVALVPLRCALLPQSMEPDSGTPSVALGRHP